MLDSVEAKFLHPSYAFGLRVSAAPLGGRLVLVVFPDAVDSTGRNRVLLLGDDSLSILQREASR
jgi:hypothetical protein